MSRTKRSDLDGMAALISRTAGEEYRINGAYGQPRLYRDGGAVEVSPRLPAGEMLRWMYAYHAGLIRAITLRLG